VDGPPKKSGVEENSKNKFKMVDNDNSCEILISEKD